MTGRIDFERICAQASLREVVGAVVALRRAGREWTGCCPFHAEKSPSFTIYEDRGRERYKCFGCGAHGDVVSFVAQYYGLDTAEAVAHLTGGSLPQTGPGPRVPEVDEEKSRAERAQRDRDIARARAIWRGAGPGRGSPVERYLIEARGIDLTRIGGIPASLRYDLLPYWRAGPQHFEKVGMFPAMIAPIQSANGAFLGAHVTYLDPAGGKLRLPDPAAPGRFLPSKKVRGAASGGAIRLGPATRHVYLAEGIETGLSVAVSVAGRKKGSVWTAVSLNNFGAAGLPESVREVTILADNDGKTPGAGQKDPRAILRDQARALALRGFSVRIAWPPPGMDFNDVLRTGTADGA